MARRFYSNYETMGRGEDVLEGEVMSAWLWTEEYRCGCVSEPVRVKKDLCGYCPTHGENRINIYRQSQDAMIHVERAKP